MRFALGLMFVVACGGKSNPPASNETPAPDRGSSVAVQQETPPDCARSGCSGTVCTEPENQVMTTCEFRPEYACYDNATCERQTDGKCGWTQTTELTACLASPPPMK
jgi:eight-cysteine-cluster-containing protein